MQLQTGSWTWSHEGQPLNIHYVEHSSGGEGSTTTILFLPTLSDVSTTEEWRTVAEDLVAQSGSTKWRAVVVDWPGLGLSDRPPIEYTVDVLEKFLVDFVTATDGPLAANSGYTLFASSICFLYIILCAMLYNFERELHGVVLYLLNSISLLHDKIKVPCFPHSRPVQICYALLEI